MFDKYDEAARKIVNDFFKEYNAEIIDVIGISLSPEPRVWLLHRIATALREAAKKE